MLLPSIVSVYWPQAVLESLFKNKTKISCYKEFQAFRPPQIYNKKSKVIQGTGMAWQDWSEIAVQRELPVVDDANDGAPTDHPRRSLDYQFEQQFFWQLLKKATERFTDLGKLNFIE